MQSHVGMSDREQRIASSLSGFQFDCGSVSRSGVGELLGDSREFGRDFRARTCSPPSHHAPITGPQTNRDHLYYPVAEPDSHTLRIPTIR